MTTTETARVDRLASVVDAELKPDSLVGSFFHSDRERGGWQGCIVAEPAPGLYLVELFSWLTGAPTEQSLVRLEEMFGWHFYDTAEWMVDHYEHGGLRERWDRERELARRPLGEAILELFRAADNKWRTVDEVRVGVSLDASDRSLVRDALAELVRRGDLVFEKGPAGRHPSAQCYRLPELRLVEAVDE